MDVYKHNDFDFVLTQWVNSINAGESKLVYADSSPGPSYTMVSDIVELNSIGPQIHTDYKQQRDNIKKQIDSLTWASMSTAQRDICVQYAYGGTATDRVTHIATSGAADPLAIELANQGTNHSLVVKACTERADPQHVTPIIFYYLSQADGEQLLKNTLTYLDLYMREAILGTQYGNSENGLLDYIESTGVHTADGLAQQGYTILNGGTINQLITALVNLLLHGVYK